MKRNRCVGQEREFRVGGLLWGGCKVAMGLGCGDVG